jgi:phosphatidylglycerol:prolipoprotein diacylglycerol transferase
MIWDMNPVAFEIFGLTVRWYGLVYVAGFLLVDWLAPKISDSLNSIKNNRAATEALEVKAGCITKKQWSDITFGAFLWGVIGGRVGEFVFYRPSVFWLDPLEIFQVWHGGMSIHGGFLGAIIFLVWFTRRYKISFWHVADSVVIPLTFVLGCGRIVNYINGELVGVPTGTDWGIIFPHIDNLLRHPSQLYESGTMFVLGLFLLGLFWGMRSKKITGHSELDSESKISSIVFQQGILSSCFLIGYGIFRFVVEFYKDSPKILLDLTMGQILCLGMISFGSWVLSSKLKKSL